MTEEVRNPISVEAKAWAHAREAARRSVWRLIDKEEQKRGAVLGVGVGINQLKTMSLYHKSNPRKKGILRKILLGGVWTRARLAHLLTRRVQQSVNADLSGRRCSISGGIGPPVGGDTRRLRDQIAESDTENACPATKELGRILGSRP